MLTPLLRVTFGTAVMRVTSLVGSPLRLALPPRYASPAAMACRAAARQAGRQSGWAEARPAVVRRARGRGASDDRRMTRIGGDVGVPELEPEVFDDAIVAVAITAGSEHRLVYYNDAFRNLFGPRKLGARAADAFTEEKAARYVRMLDEVF